MSPQRILTDTHAMKQQDWVDLLGFDVTNAYFLSAPQLLGETGNILVWFLNFFSNLWPMGNLNNKRQRNMRFSQSCHV